MKIKYILALCVCLIFTFMMVSPAVAKDKCKRGIAVGSGEWADEYGSGYTHFNLKRKFPGNASGGHLFVSLNCEDYFSVVADPKSVVFLFGEWPVIDADGNESTVSGYAMWAMGKIVDSSIDYFLENPWCVMGAFDGGKPSHNIDFIMASPGLDESNVSAEYDMALDGKLPLWAEMVKGNVKLKVIGKQRCRK